MRLHDIKPAEGSNKKSKRLGRGQGSGKGGTSTKGHKGDKATSGYVYRAEFEGGQMPLVRRVPKFGFKNPFRVEYQAINLDTLQEYAEQTPGLTSVDKAFLKKKGIITNTIPRVKVLARGELNVALTVEAHKFSEAAKAAIEKAGGQAILIPDIKSSGKRATTEPTA
jgi:large subunit ribosomal protein L15